MCIRDRPKGVKVGSKVLHPFIVDLYRQTGRNLLSTDGIAPDEVKVSIQMCIRDSGKIDRAACRELARNIITKTL